MRTPQQVVDLIIDSILIVEGSEYTNHPADRGGPTKYGITLATLRGARKDPNLGAAAVAALTQQEARTIYYDKYVVEPGFDHVLEVLPEVGAKVIDVGVNCGTNRAAKWLQTAINSFNRSYKTPADWPEIKVDGRVGNATIDALRRFCKLRGGDLASRVLVRAINAQQGVHYLNLGMKDPQQEAFMLGWFDKRVA